MKFKPDRSISAGTGKGPRMWLYMLKVLYFRSMGKQEDIIRAFAEKLKAVYMEKGIGLQDLDLSDTDKVRLESILKGELDNVDLIFLERIAQALDVPAYSLLK